MKRILFVLLFIITACGTQDSGDETRVDGILDSEHRIFVTSQSFSGNLAGIEGADDKCREAALSAGLVRSYKAIISTNTNYAIDRLIINGSVYVINSTSEILVASSGADLWSSESSNLLSSINYDENKNLVSVTPWTGTTASGGGGTGFCDNWSSDQASFNGDTGATSSSNYQWIENSFKDCSQLNPLYCISQ